MATPPRSRTAGSRGSPRGAGVRGRLQLERDGVSFLGPARVDLLEAIAACGSITGAAKVVGLSYKAAWDAVSAMNEQAVSPLVTRSAGGARGGGTALTTYGRRVIELVRTIERDYASVLAALDDPESALAAYGALRRQLSLRTSARNRWIGRVVAVTRGAVRTEVAVAIAPEIVVRADVSTESAARLGLREGVELCALVKATSITLRRGVRVRRAAGDPNLVEGVVDRVRRGDGQVEVRARLPGARSITAVLTDAVQARSLARGARVTASFGAEQVLLVTLA